MYMCPSSTHTYLWLILCSIYHSKSLSFICKPFQQWYYCVIGESVSILVAMVIFWSVAGENAPAKFDWRALVHCECPSLAAALHVL